MAEKFKNWMESAWSFQQEMYKMFGRRRWDDLSEDKVLLKKKIEIPLEYRFGENYENNKNIKSQVERIIKTLENLFEVEKYNQGLDFTFINIKMKDDEKDQRLTTCVFWLKNSEDKVKCLDLDGRHYDSWNDFIKNNVFPDCYMMYPKCGRYHVNGKEDFAEIIVEESVSCSAGRIIKRSFDVLTTIGGIVGAGILVCNPVSGPLILGAAVTSGICGIYSAGNNISQLVDIHKHEGGLAFDSKTLLTVGELAVNVAGSAAIGVSAGIKGFTATSGKVLKEGSMAFRLANNATKITRVVSGFNAGYSFIVVINNYCENKVLTLQDKLRLMKVLCYGFNVFLTEAMVQGLVDYLVSNLTLESIIECFLRNRAHYEITRRVYTYASDQLPDLLERIFPDSFKKYFQKFTDIKPLVNSGLNILSSTVSILKKNEPECLDIVGYLEVLNKELQVLLKEYNEYKKRNANELSDKLSIEASNHFMECAVNFGIDLFENDSRFSKKINSLFEIHEKIETILKTCFNCSKEQNGFKIKEKDLFSKFCGLVKKGNLNSGDQFFVNKMYFFCNSFETLFKKFLELYYYEHFLYNTIKKTNYNIANFVSCHYQIHDLREHIYKESLNLLEDNVERFHREFDSKFENTELINKRKERIFYELTILNCNSWLNKDEFYKKAQELLPNLTGKLNENSTTFDGFESLNLAIIKSKNNEFIIFFYVVVEDNNLKGFLLFDENLNY